MAELLLFFGVPLIANGINATKSTQDIKDSIATMTDSKKQIDDMMSKDTTLTDIYKLDKKTQDTYFKSITSYMSTKNDLERTLTNFYKQMRQIELTGILMIIVIFFLLLLKHFKLLGTIQYILFYPFIFIYEKISGNKVG